MLYSMIRAIFFDFYSVWTPDQFAGYIEAARQQNPDVAAALDEAVQKYYLGLVDINYVGDSFRFKLSGTYELPANLFVLKQTDISPALIDFMRYLHGHFLKLGILANIGSQEYSLLTGINAQYQLFEVIVGSLNSGSPIFTQEVFVKALQDIGEPPGSCLVVTGNEEYQRFAESCGIQVLRFDGFAKLKDSIDRIIQTGSTIPS